MKPPEKSRERLLEKAMDDSDAAIIRENRELRDTLWQLRCRCQALAAAAELGLAHAEHLRMDTPEDEDTRLALVETIKRGLSVGTRVSRESSAECRRLSSNGVGPGCGCVGDACALRIGESTRNPEVAA